ASSRRLVTGIGEWAVRGGMGADHGGVRLFERMISLLRRTVLRACRTSRRLDSRRCGKFAIAYDHDLTGRRAVGVDRAFAVDAATAKECRHSAGQRDQPANEHRRLQVHTFVPVSTTVLHSRIHWAPPVNGEPSQSFTTPWLSDDAIHRPSGLNA